MKKLLLAFLCCLIVCGCGNKNDGYQISELVPNTYLNMAHLSGTLKNVSNNNCKEVLVEVEYVSGTLKNDGYIYLNSPKKGDTVSFNETLIGASNIENIENYKINLKNIKCYAKDTK